MCLLLAFLSFIQNLDFPLIFEVALIWFDLTVFLSRSVLVISSIGFASVFYFPSLSMFILLFDDYGLTFKNQTTLLPPPLQGNIQFGYAPVVYYGIDMKFLVDNQRAILAAYTKIILQGANDMSSIIMLDQELKVLLWFNFSFAVEIIDWNLDVDHDWLFDSSHRCNLLANSRGLYEHESHCKVQPEKLMVTMI
ncbi:hypothetical protein ACJIZ3_016830 [Penstemon smallii]|uniref:Uncharacterized protein n=1 Tax=Penstemon smallii TaxID=265156 RepID=A0ABD3SUX5_9LAMI